MRMQKLLLVGVLMLSSAAAPAQQGPASPAETDPVKMGWMQGSPPLPDKQVLYEDLGHYQFPKTRWSFSHFRELVPTTNVWRGPSRISTLPIALRNDLDSVSFALLEGAGMMTWGQAIEAVYSDAVLVMHKGRIVYERYYGVMTPQTPHIAFSVTKSYFGTIAAMLIVEGKLDEKALITRYIPELAGSAFADATVRQVLDMTTGLDYSEDYNDPKADVWEFSYAGGIFPKRPGYAGARTFYDHLKSVRKKGEHGSRFTYNSVNTEVTGWLIARVTGKPPHVVLGERIWQKLGAEQDAYMLVDSVGTPFTAGGLNVTLRDQARFGEMMRQNGRFNGQQIVPASVVADIRGGGNKAAFAQAGYKALSNWSYRNQWWVSHNQNGAFTARGIHGQTIYIDPKAEMVIVRFASNPAATNSSFDKYSLPAYQAIADRLMQPRRRR
jgi:CubicO group peptidase (beta-lactamase class C family)